MDEYLDRVKERAEDQGRPVSELLFEDFCKQSEIRCERFEAEEVSTGVRPKAPDYDLIIDDRTIIAEVKEITQNKEERESERLLKERGYGSVLGGTPGARVRKKINDSSPQIRKRTLGRRPGILVLYDYGRTAKHLDPYHIMTAMYGLEVVDIAVPADPSAQPYSMGTRFGPGKKMTQDANTSISAIGVLAVTAPNGFIRLDVFHNRCAAVPIDPALLARNGIAQYQIDVGTRTWVETLRGLRPIGLVHGVV